MSNQSVTISSKTAENMFEQLTAMEKQIVKMKKQLAKLFQLEPAYGSKEWWEKEEREVDEEIKAGKYTVYDNVNDLIADLHAGK